MGSSEQHADAVIVGATRHEIDCTVTVKVADSYREDLVGAGAGIDHHAHGAIAGANGHAMGHSIHAIAAAVAC